jgi:hypothetical protein
MSIHLQLLLLFFFVRVLLLQEGVLDGWIMHTKVEMLQLRAAGRRDLVQIWLLILEQV